MTNIFNLPDELILEILAMSHKNLHYTCRILYEIGYATYHSTLDSPPRTAIAENKTERIKKQNGRVGEYREVLNNLTKETFKTQAINRINLTIAHFDVQKKRTSDASSLSQSIPHFPNLEELTLTLGHYKSATEAAILGASGSVKYLTLIIDVIKFDDAYALAREISVRYPNLTQLNIYRYQNEFRGFTAAKERRFMLSLEYALRHTHPLPQLKTVLFKWYERHIEKRKESWVLCLCDHLDDFVVYRRSGRKGFKKISDLRRIMEVLVECHTTHACQFDGHVFEVLVAINSQMEEDYFMSREFRTQIPPRVFYTVLLTFTRNFRPTHEPDLRDLVELTRRMDAQMAHVDAGLDAFGVRVALDLGL